MKGLVKNPQKPEINLAKAATRDSAAQFLQLQSATPRFRRNHPHPQMPHSCVLWGRQSTYIPTRLEIADLRMCGCPRIEHLSVTEFSIAYILNVHFKAGEWGNYPRCGSVVTVVMNGRSLYARVNRFLRVDGDECPGYACVSWFSEPHYLFDGEVPMGVRVTEDGRRIDREVGSIVRITQIDPSPIIVERDLVNRVFFMMRDTGYDTRRRE